MKQSNLKILALTGLSTGLLIASQAPASSAPTQLSQSVQTTSNNKSIKTTKNKDTQAPSDSFDQAMNDLGGNLGYHLMSEEELMIELTPEGQAMYKSLSPEGKALALEVSSQRCNQMNTCKGFNACQTDSNPCAGKGDCKGKGKCAFSDKNLSVKIVYDKMMQEKREKALKNHSN